MPEIPPESTSSSTDSRPHLVRGWNQDACGRRIQLLDPYLLHVMHRTDVMPADTLQAIAREVGAGLPRWQHLGYLATVVLFSLAVVFLVIWKLTRGKPTSSLETALWIMNITLFSLGAGMTWRAARRGRLQRVRRVMLAHHRCPGCGYNLRGLPRDPDTGFTMCSECGAVWHLQRQADRKDATNTQS